MCIHTKKSVWNLHLFTHAELDTIFIALSHKKGAERTSAVGLT